MKHSLKHFLWVLPVLFFSLMPHAFSQETPLPAERLLKLLPQPGDTSNIWWRHGRPTLANIDSSEKSIRTGHFGMIFNTRSLQIPHLGPVGKSTPLGSLPPATLDLTLEVDGKHYRATESKEPTRFTGQRLIESGLFLQRFDITDLVFKADDGSELPQESRLECSAWSDRLGFKLVVRPPLLPIPDGDAAFGILDGGFGLTPTKRLDITAEECTVPETFTFSLWVFVPEKFSLPGHTPWLVCSHGNEAADGHFGISLDREAKPGASLNIGGGKCFTVPATHRLRINQWNHLAVCYDADTLRLYVNGSLAGQTKIGRPRNPRPGPIAIGDRQDMKNPKNLAYRFFGAVDEIQVHDRALPHNEIRELARPNFPRQKKLPPLKQWTFRPEGQRSPTLISEKWTSATMAIRLTSQDKSVEARWQLPAGTTWESPEWKNVAIAVDPSTVNAAPDPRGLVVEAKDEATGTPCPVVYEGDTGWFVLDLNKVSPVPPAGEKPPSNDAMERIGIRISNSSDKERLVRLMFDKDHIRNGIGSPITGISAILCDALGIPTGLPVQLSKNWHIHPSGGVYSGQWFHGISQVRVPPGESIDLELRLVYGHWGKLPAASHAQLSLIGWGGNSLWEQSALGAWGESICYDPEQAQASCTITDVRPMMVNSQNSGGKWSWTHNHGGGDFFRLFDPEGERVPHAKVKATTLKSGPCLTEARYTGEIKNTGIAFSETVSIARTDDIVTATFKLRMDVSEPVDFSRFAIFQIGADSYLSTREQKYAVGNKSGLIKSWEARWGGNEYKGDPIELAGPAPWISLHDAFIPEGEIGARANRGIIVRNWKARLGGREAPLLVAEHGISRKHNFEASTIDLVPPPEVKRLEPGDFVETTIELVLIPREAADYYGPNKELRAALQAHPNSWEPVHRQATGGDLRVSPTVGNLGPSYPGIFIAADNNRAEFTLEGGVGFVPITIGNLDSHAGYTLCIDGEPLDQNVHGNDFWQTNFNPDTRTWSRTYNIPATSGTKRVVSLTPAAK